MKLQTILNLCFFCLTYGTLPAQVPSPAPAQQKPLLITGGTAHIGNGRVVENSAIIIEDGKITFAEESAILPRRDYTGFQRIDAAGKHIYPGLIAPATNLGLVDIGAVRATRDYNEVGSINPNVRSIIAYNTDSPIIPTVRSQGVLLAQVAPQGGRIPGMSSIVQLDAWNWEDAAYSTDDGIFLNWPGLFSYSWSERSRTKNEDYSKQVEELRQFFLEARAYAALPEPSRTNLRFEAMKPLFSGERRLYIEAEDAKEITHAVHFAGEFGIRAVIVDGRDAWMVAELLKENDVPVILRETQSLPNRIDSDVDQPFKTPAMLKEAGVLFCFSADGFWQQRNLAFQAGQAVGYGLGREEALAGLTSNTAKILGIEKRTGTLEADKDANLIICSGDLLDVRSSQVEMAFIQGRAINLDNQQKALYRKFKAKYDRGR
ncbi:MAG: amidohydrolase family protein [Lewinellaceae bacterium]|nr:amidohydrolase family protein [Lewinellaceae bacterium]